MKEIMLDPKGRNQWGDRGGGQLCWCLWNGLTNHCNDFPMLFAASAFYIVSYSIRFYFLSPFSSTISCFNMRTMTDLTHCKGFHFWNLRGAEVPGPFWAPWRPRPSTCEVRSPRGTTSAILAMITLQKRMVGWVGTSHYSRFNHPSSFVPHLQ